LCGAATPESGYLWVQDLTEEDIRNYAASLAGNAGAPGPTSSFGQSGGPDKDNKVVIADPHAAKLGDIDETRGDTQRLAQSIAKYSGVGPNDEGYRDEPDAPDDGLELALGADNALALSRRDDGQKPKEEEPPPLTEDELMRLEVLAELERSQMPAIMKDDGRLQKTIEHYTFADTREIATISIDLDKDLYEGAAASLLEENVEVVSQESEVTIWVRKVPAFAQATAIADWRLHLTPLLHSIVPSETSWKVRKGKVSVKLKKKKAQDWRKMLKF